MNEIDIKLSSVEVKVQTKQLKCRYTREMATDLVMMYDMTEEIDRQKVIENREKIIDDLLDGKN